MQSSVARDWRLFDSTQKALELEHPEIIEQPSIRKITERTKMPVLHLAKFAVVFSVLAFVMFSFSQIWTSNSVNNDLRAEHNRLLREGEALMQQSVGGMTLLEIERIAREEYGMAPPTQDQIIYISMNGQDHAEVFGKQSWWRQIWVDLSGFFSK
jgi:hypothetical protein